MLARRRRSHHDATLRIAVAVVATGVALSLILGAVTGQLLSSLIAVMAATLWCLAFALPLGGWFFPTRPRLALGAIIVTAVAAACGGILVLAGL